MKGLDRDNPDQRESDDELDRYAEAVDSAFSSPDRECYQETLSCPIQTKNTGAKPPPSVRKFVVCPW